MRRLRRRALALLFACIAALAFVAAAWAGNGGFAPKTPESPNAVGINNSYKLVALFTGIIFVLVEGALVWFVFKYRRRGRARTAEGPQVHGATRLELIWTAAPVVILAAIAAFVFYEIGELHVPAHRVVKLDIHSADVAHSWWIPQLGGKFDAIPGVTNHTWFTAQRAGTFDGQCGEFCGVYHAEMAARVVAGSVSSYTSFVASQRRPLVLGAQEWSGVCAKCHGFTGKGGYGPNIQSNTLLVQRAGLTRLLFEGQNTIAPVSNYMPPVGRGWNASQINALIAYMKTNVYKPTTSGG